MGRPDVVPLMVLVHTTQYPLWMSARALSRHVVALHLYAHSQSRAVYKTQHLCSRLENEEREKEEQTDTVQQTPSAAASGRYTLVYNPSAYYPKSVQRSATLGGSQMEEEASQPVLNAAFRQQSNPYTVSSSRHLSSAKNALLSLAFSRQGANKGVKSARPKGPENDVKGEPRAFHRCRPEYLSMVHDISQRPPAIHFKEASLLLHKVTLMKGNMEPSDIARFLGELGHLASEQTRIVRGDTRFYMLLRYSVENLQNFSNQQLLEVLRAFVRLGLSHSHSILDLYETEFVHRAGKMDLHEMLLVADLWRCLGRSVPHYLGRLCDCISPHFSRMGPPELVQLLYILGEGRQCPAHLLQPLEGILMRHLDELKAEEVGAVCLGLFKSQSALSEEAVRRLVDRACTLLEQMSDFGMVNVLKLMRFSHLDHLPWLEAMGSEVPRRAPQMGVQGLMHVALACSALHYRDVHILLAVAEHLPPKASLCRSKDAAKFLWAFGTLGILPNQCPNLYPCLTEILREREAEFHHFPEHLLTGLLGLAFAGQFPTDLLSVALSPEFVNRNSRSQELELKKDLFTLDGTVEVELPGWTGPRLSLAVREEVTKQLWEFAQSDVCQKLEVLEAEAVLKELLGGDAFVHKRMILPHMRSIDLEVHLDPNEQPLPLASEPRVHCKPALDTELTPLGWERHSGVTLTDDLLAQLTGAKKIPAQPPPKPVQPPALRLVEPQTERESILSVGVDLTDGLLHALTKPGSRSPALSQVTAKSSVVRLAVQEEDSSMEPDRCDISVAFFRTKNTPTWGKVFEDELVCCSECVLYTKDEWRQEGRCSLLHELSAELAHSLLIKMLSLGHVTLAFVVSASAAVVRECADSDGAPYSGVERSSSSGETCLNWFNLTTTYNLTVELDGSSGRMLAKGDLNEGYDIYSYVLDQTSDVGAEAEVVSSGEGQMKPQNVHPPRQSVAVKPDPGISRRVNLGPSKKKDLGALGYALATLLMAVIVLSGAGITIGYVYRKGVKLRLQQEQRAYEQEMHRINLPLSAFINPACDLTDEQPTTASVQQMGVKQESGEEEKEKPPELQVNRFESDKENRQESWGI
ncbi:hypothetical protein NFI96_003839 [Prochilodus magdalenae]|nr:hypothetical protein NFI96_003839 [Prochilodus magdalenae]